MKRQSIFLIITAILVTGFFNKSVKAQSNDSVEVNDVLDGAYARTHVPKREPVPYVHIREADAMFSKRLMRKIDLDQKINHPLYFPLQPVNYPEGPQPERQRVNLTYLLYNIGAMAPDENNRKMIFDFDPNDFSNWYADPIPVNDTTTRNKLLTYSEEDQVRDSVTNELTNVTRERTLNLRDIKSVIFWEEWVFDKERSVMDVRIIAMAPVAKYTNNKGEQLVKRLFWIYFPHYRDLFSEYEVFNTQNDAQRRTFEDLFRNRKFESFILAESNVYDNRWITDYLMGIDAMHESKRIEEEIFQYEHDLWEY